MSRRIPLGTSVVDRIYLVDGESRELIHTNPSTVQTKEGRGALAKEHTTATEQIPIKEKSSMSHSTSTNFPHTFDDLVTLADNLGMRPSAVLRRLCENGWVPSKDPELEPAGADGSNATAEKPSSTIGWDAFTADQENPDLLWGKEFDGIGSKICTYKLSHTGESGIQVEAPETMTATEARELAEAMTSAADYLDSAGRID